jgi:hypothetical protein
MAHPRNDKVNGLVYDVLAERRSKSFRESTGTLAPLLGNISSLSDRRSRSGSSTRRGTKGVP